MQDVEWTAKGPRKDQLAVSSNSTIGGNTVRALKDPGSDIFPTERPEKAEADAVLEGFIITHMAGRRRSVVGREDVAA
jgi:hypothetical protein